jgi:hypothetical protein
MDPITTAIIAAVAAEPIVRSLLLAAFVQRAEPDPAGRPSKRPCWPKAGA